MNSRTAATAVTSLGATSTVLCLVALPWWPSGYADRSFLAFRSTSAREWRDPLERPFPMTGFDFAFLHWGWIVLAVTTVLAAGAAGRARPRSRTWQVTLVLTVALLVFEIFWARAMWTGEGLTNTTFFAALVFIGPGLAVLGCGAALIHSARGSGQP